MKAALGSVGAALAASKTLLWAGEVLHLAKHHGISGIFLDVASFDFATVVRHELSLVEKLRAEKSVQLRLHRCILSRSVSAYPIRDPRYGFRWT